ncbi:hypothetical protein BN946_scf185042.g172 [Trametes cinnabarina]|uniref:Uncharacterized protein n=1 Tax=Pycnoporus cinnabarinus TaxID=5643 RepID=A0A060S4L9_PYCCI|nr:hypothetical protein BN946_scf185042.g172 [Trametes cinnabarina]
MDIAPGMEYGLLCGHFLHELLPEPSWTYHVQQEVAPETPENVPAGQSEHLLLLESQNSPGSQLVGRASVSALQRSTSRTTAQKASVRDDSRVYREDMVQQRRRRVSGRLDGRSFSRPSFPPTVRSPALFQVRLRRRDYLGLAEERGAQAPALSSIDTPPPIGHTRSTVDCPRSPSVHPSAWACAPGDPYVRSIESIQS